MKSFVLWNSRIYVCKDKKSNLKSFSLQFLFILESNDKSLCLNNFHSSFEFFFHRKAIYNKGTATNVESKVKEGKLLLSSLNLSPEAGRQWDKLENARRVERKENENHEGYIDRNIFNCIIRARTDINCVVCRPSNFSISLVKG